MKRKLITAIIAVALLIAGCSDTANVSEGQDRMMEKVEDEWGICHLCRQRHQCYVHKRTRRRRNFYRYAQC